MNYIKKHIVFIHKLKIVFYLFMAVIILLFVLHLLFPFKYNISYSTTITDKNDKILHAYLSDDDKWRMFTEKDEISKDLEKAILFKEDKYFYYHLGVNPIAIARAFFNNTVKRKRTSGASTITMQVVRLIAPKNRTYINKLVEMFRAFQLEMALSKKEILQLYLNLVPYGGNIEGIKSASVLYFNKMPNHLSLSEITALSVIPNRPNSLKIGEKNRAIQDARDIWLQKMLVKNIFPKENINDALAEVFQANRKKSPVFAPHFCRNIKMQTKHKMNVSSTLDLNLQLKIEAQLDNYMRNIEGSKVTNAAILVIDNASNEIVAYIGSADFYSKENSGQVDGVKAKRQPGSTLKPFIYGLAFDNGLITPKTVVYDVPTDFSGYTPANFDSDFRGYVTVEFALAQSLNIPAVQTLDKIGLSEFLNKLIASNFKSIEKNKDQLGLSVALGGCGATLEELTLLFAALANNGVYKKPISLKSDTLSNVKAEILSKESAFMISEILTQLERPDLPYSWKNAKNLPQIAWKTGTSYGRRDAWSIGFNEENTVGVWMGNFSGEGVPELTGANFATPLLFNVFNTISKSASKNWLKAPKSLPFRVVCSNSGLPPNTPCEHQTVDYYLPLKSSNATCNHLEKIYLTEDEGMSYCLYCLPEAGYKTKWLKHHPNEILAYFEMKKINYEKIPPHNADCEHHNLQGNEPIILTPKDGTKYYISKENPEELVLKSQASANAEKIFWYVNDVFLECTDKNKATIYLPPPGNIKISCSDNLGRNRDVFIEVVYY